MAKKEKHGLMWVIGGVMLCLVPTGMGGAFAVGTKSEVLKSRFAIEDAMNRRDWDDLVKVIPKEATDPKYLSRNEVREWIRLNVEPNLSHANWSVNVRDEHTSNHDKGSFSFGFGYDRWNVRTLPGMPLGIPTVTFGYETAFRVYVYQHNFVIGKTLDKDGVAKFPIECEVISPKDRFEIGKAIINSDKF
jgi:hypothetical protein